MKRLLFIALTFPVFIAGCALSPQQVSIQPNVSYTGPQIGQQRHIDVSVVDQRARKIIGSRGGVYSDSSLISVKNNPVESLSNAVAAGLGARGYIVNSQNESAAKMQLILDTLSYEASQKTLPKDILLEAVLRVEVDYNGQIYSSRYASKGKHRFVKSPSSERNQEIINDLLTATLDRLFNDSKLQAFLAQPAMGMEQKKTRSSITVYPEINESDDQTAPQVLTY